MSSDVCSGGDKTEVYESKSKSPSGKKQRQVDCYSPHHSQKGSNQKSARSERNVLAPLENLRYSDLVYLLNILKLQRAKFEDSDCSRDKWVGDIQLALSVAISGPATGNHDSGTLGEMANLLLDRVSETAFGPNEDNHIRNLRYEHFIGPLVTICFAADKSNDSSSIVKLCFDQFERYYAKVMNKTSITDMRGNKRSNSYTGKASSFEVNSLDCYLNFLTSASQFMKANHHAKLQQALAHISYEKISSQFLVFPEDSTNQVLDILDDLFGVQNPSGPTEQDNDFFYNPNVHSHDNRLANNSEMATAARRQHSMIDFKSDKSRKSVPG